MRSHLIICLSAIAISATPALAGPWVSLFENCPEADATTQVACVVTRQVGDHNTALTEIRMENSFNRQMSLTYQRGDGNVAYTGLVSIGKDEDQQSITIQKGSGHYAYTYLEGEDNKSTTIQTGEGQWSATSSIGNGTETVVTQHN